MPNHAPSQRSYYLTPAGRGRLRRRIEEARLAYLTVCASNGDAAGAGDSSVWHDNFAYEENQRQMHQLARRVSTLEEVLLRSREVQPRSRAPLPCHDSAPLGPRSRAHARVERAGFVAADPPGELPFRLIAVTNAR